MRLVTYCLQDSRGLGSISLRAQSVCPAQTAALAGLRAARPHTRLLWPATFPRVMKAEDDAEDGENTLGEPS